MTLHTDNIIQFVKTYSYPALSKNTWNEADHNAKQCHHPITQNIFVSLQFSSSVSRRPFCLLGDQAQIS
jgi:hypothetical protein